MHPLAAFTTKTDVINLFSPYGNVTDVHIVMDRTGPELGGFGYVTMETTEEARAAIRALDDKAVGSAIFTLSEVPSNKTLAGASRSARTLPAQLQFAFLN